jgi:nicotinamide-nucleotide amidase
VPREFEAMVTESVVPRLVSRTGGRPLPSATLRTLGIPESELSAQIEERRVDLAGVELASLPNAGGVDIRIVGQDPLADDAVARVEAELRELLGDAIFGSGEETIEEVLAGLLRARGLRLVLAESCTGGLIGYRVTRVPGSSDVFTGGIVAYANAVKESLLGVSPDLLARHGAVSAEVALAMARGALSRFSADIGLAITGIAGPGGGTEDKPVGLVFIGLADAGGRRDSRRYLLPGDRHQVRERAAGLALGRLRRFILGLPPS